ncbi:MAG: hypothetical protein OEM59_13925, partial [Rhodospirillales bacterium]|nr:hypothetical protein [Rhodospirillales bacterium]
PGSATVNPPASAIAATIAMKAFHMTPQSPLLRFRAITGAQNSAPIIGMIAPAQQKNWCQICVNARSEAPGLPV